MSAEAREAAEALRRVLDMVRAGELTAPARTLRRLEGAQVVLDALSEPVADPSAVPAAEGTAPEVVQLRHGLVATYVLREKPAPPPPAEPWPEDEPPPWGPVGFPDWYTGPR